MERANIFQSYLKNQTINLQKTFNISEEEAQAFVKKTVKAKYKSPRIRAAVTVRPGFEEKRTISFNEFVTTSKKNIVCPNGRVYINPNVRPATVRQYTKDLIKRRKFHKKKMFEHQQNGESEAQAMEKGNESRIKIGANTLSGGAKNSKYSCFYDKSGFNAITSVARLMIKTNYVVLEQVLGGNYCWENIEELTNNIILRIGSCPSKENIMKMVDKYNLYIPTQEDLMERYQHFMNLYEVGPAYLYKDKFVDFKDKISNSYANQYMTNGSVYSMLDISPILETKTKVVDLSSVKTIVSTLKEHEVIFLFYVNNLRALFWQNTETFRPLLHKMIEPLPENIPTNVDISALSKLDGDMLPIVSTKFAKLVKGKELSKVIKEEKEIAQVLANYLTYLHGMLNDIDDIFSLFFRTEIGSTRISIKDKMWRNTALGSDTDSIIYTLKEWVKWYAGDYFNDDLETDAMLAVVAFFVAKIADHNTTMFSEHLGCRGEDTKLLKMKGEYDFNSMIFFLIKKHYTGVMTIQEGRVLPEIKLDIKGLSLRGSAVPKMVVEKLKDFTIETQYRQSASHYVREVITLEKEMARNLRSGSTQFLKSLSVRNREEYKNADSSFHFYFDFWNNVFGEKYGYAQTPVKMPCIFLMKFNKKLFDAVKQIDKEVGFKLEKYVKSFPKRDLASIVINPVLRAIPEEIIVLINMRKHIYTNLKPLYLTMESMGIPFMHNHKHKLLVSEYYDEVGLSLLASDEEEEAEAED